MNKYLLIIITAIFATISCTQPKDKKVVQKYNSVKFELREILMHDTLAYEQFLMSKRCFCRENYLTLQDLRIDKKYILKTDEFYKFYDIFREKGYLFFVSINKNILTSKLDSIFFQEMINNRNNISEDHLFIDDKNVICETMSSNNSFNRKQYVDLISNLNNYNNPLDYKKVWNGDENYLKEKLKHYQVLKKDWYHLSETKNDTISIR